MRSSIPTLRIFWKLKGGKNESQSLLNEVKYSNEIINKMIEEQKKMSQSLLNEVKYSNLFVSAYLNPFESKESQSLLNEVKYSNCYTILMTNRDLLCRNPF